MSESGCGILASTNLEVELSASSHPLHDYHILPLTFLQTYRSIGLVVDSLVRNDITTRLNLDRHPQLKTFLRFTAIPLYYHLTTSGYGAAMESEIVGWMYLRGQYQILYVEALVVNPSWRRKGVGKTLLAFAEQQAIELHREWLGLTVTTENSAAVSLYEKMGYHSSHSWIFKGHYSGGPPKSVNSLNPLWGIAAERTYRRLVLKDISHEDNWLAPADSRFLTLEPYRRRGKEWALFRDNVAVVYLNHFEAMNSGYLFVATDPEWWGSSEVIDVISWILNSFSVGLEVNVRFASENHHRLMISKLKKFGLNDSKSMTMRMFKQLAGTPQSGIPA